MKVLMDGIGSVSLSTLAIFVVAWCLKPFLHRLVGDFLVGLGNYIVSGMTVCSHCDTITKLTIP
jgi:hypothetical protein